MKALVFGSIVAALLASPAIAHAQIPVLVDGKTIDFAYDGHDVREADAGYTARIFVPAEVRKDTNEPVPLLVFLHGTNRHHMPLRFVGGPAEEPDLRIVLGDLIKSGALPPFVLVAPTTTVACVVPFGMCPDFDLDRLVESTLGHLRGRATIDLDRVVLVGHSGGGCNRQGGLFSGLAGTSLALRAVFSIDACMTPEDAIPLASAPFSTDVFVSYQPVGWSRPFDDFRAKFDEAAKARTGAVRVLEELHPDSPHPHNAMVEETLRAHLADVLRKAP